MTKVSVLYVEDEPFLGRIVKESLESRDFTVHMATDGSQAVSLFQLHKPDICILDVMLPEKDGYSSAKEIRQSDPHVPIIFVTAKTQIEDVVKGFETGGNDYIRKPFSMEELIVRINNLLALANPKFRGQAERYLLGQYEFLVNRYELKTGNSVKKLSHREASLLKILCENRNTTVSRKEMLMAVWGDDSFFNSRNLDVYITKLRDYLKQDPSVQIITIKGVGYHFAIN
jgi:DNA-binding response OmpR family regulator